MTEQDKPTTRPTSTGVSRPAGRAEDFYGMVVLEFDEPISFDDTPRAEDLYGMAVLEFDDTPRAED